MKWILILVSAIQSAGGGETVSVATAEFEDQYSCQQAARRAEQLVSDAVARSTKTVRADCLPKGAAAR